MSTYNVVHADCLAALRDMPDASVDAVVTDPPYGLSNTTPAQVADTITQWVTGNREYLPSARGFMGHEWDGFVPPVAVWDECLRVLKPGGHLLAFAGSRTHDLMTLGIRLAGFEIRDSVAWLYGSGFPKSLDVSKAIDKRRDWSLVERLAGEIRRARAAAGLSLAEIGQATLAATDGTYGKWYHRGGHMFFETGRSLPSRPEWEQLRHVLPIAPEFAEVYDEAEREVLRETTTNRYGGSWAEQVASGMFQIGERTIRETAPATDAARQWEGWGTALKPAFEPVTLARKPLDFKGVNVLEVVESGLRNQGVEGAIQWTTRPASGAASQSPMPTSGSTSQQPTAATSARNASASATPPTESATASATATSTASGGTQTPTRSGPTAETPTGDSATPSSTPTAPTARAAAKPSRHSSRLTTSTAAAPSIESPYTERSTPNSAAKDSHPVTESFAGIATGLSGSWTHVRIDRLSDGTFVWPDGLPRDTSGKRTVAANILEHGTGALNIDGCRIGWQDPSERGIIQKRSGRRTVSEGWGLTPEDNDREKTHPSGRWPANVVLDESQAAELDRQSGNVKTGATKPHQRDPDSAPMFKVGKWMTHSQPASEGGASRFFYVAKAPKSERPVVDGIAHPTVKPLALMRWLVRMVTPPGGTVLDPFAGSGTTLEAAMLEGFNVTGIEREADYLPLIQARVERATTTIGGETSE